MATGTKPSALDHGRGCQCGATHDVGTCDGGGKIARYAGLKTAIAQFIHQRFCLRCLSCPHLHRLYRQDLAKRLWNKGSNPPRTHHQQTLGIAARQHRGRQCRGGNRAACGDLIAINLGQRFASARVVQHIRGKQTGQTPRRVAWKDIDGLDAQVAICTPGRHDQHRALATVVSR